MFYLNIGRQFQVDIRNSLGFTKREKIAVEKVELVRTQENNKNRRGNVPIALRIQSASSEQIEGNVE